MEKWTPPKKPSLYLKKTVPYRLTLPYSLRISYWWACLGRSHSPLKSCSTPCITCLFISALHASFVNFFSTFKRLRVSSPLTAHILKWHRGKQCSLTSAVLSRHFSDLLLRLLLWEVCAKAENFPLVFPWCLYRWCFTPIMISAQLCISSSFRCTVHLRIDFCTVLDVCMVNL